MKNPLQDKEFLYNLNQDRHKEIYAKIISLSFDEKPLEQIEGRVTSGSINIDGTSTVRRTCNLTLIAKDVNITDFYWGVSNKFTLEIGLKNNINKEYPNIIWFKQGIYVITSFNSSLTNSNYTISINGKDKMCLLNGEIGGSLPSSIDFGKIDNYEDTYTEVKIKDCTQYVANKYYIYEDGKYKISLNEFNEKTKYYTKDTLLKQDSLKLKDIIKEAVHEYGKELYHNIIINDLDNYGLELLEYRGDKPLYLLYDEDAHIYTQMVIDEDFPIYIETSSEKYDYEPVENLSIETFYSNPEEYWVKSEESEDFYYQVSQYNEELTYYTRSYIAPTVDEEAKQIKDIPVFNNAIDDFNDSRTIFYLDTDILDEETGKRDKSRWSATKVEYGATAGYRTTDLTYPGDLISSVGESLTSILDKIKNTIGAFEYFYDIDGRFIFQAKKIYSQNSWNTLVNADDNIFARDAVEESPYSYSFEDVNLIQQFQNTPAINNVKNDYSIWGTRKGISGAEIPIHARYAIHNKPVYYHSYDGNTYTTLEMNEVIKMPNRQKNPDGLNDDWWNIFDWAEYYKALTGEYPTSYIGQYCKETTKLDLNAIFPPGYTWNINRPVFLFDVNKDGTLGYIGHNPIRDDQLPENSCWHTYSYFLDLSKNGNLAYIYKPKIPTNVNINYKKVDWREIIYQMALDYFKHGQEKDFLYNVQNNNLKMDGLSSYYPEGETGYEAFYTDIQGFWRQLYDPNPDIIYDTEGGYYSEEKFYKVKELTNEELKTSGDIYYYYDSTLDEYIIAKNLSYKQCTEDSSFIASNTYYIKKNQNAYEKVENLTEDIFNNNKSNYYYQIDYYSKNKELALGSSYRVKTVWNPFKEKDTFTCDYYLKGDTETDDYSATKYYWNKNVVLAPEQLNFWIDFYDGNDSLMQYSIATIGDRPKVVNDSKITSIYFRNVPQVIFTNGQDYNGLDIKTGYTYIWLDKSMQDLFSISAQGKSAEEEMNELFNNYSYCSEGVTITAVPIYNLEPNTLIYIYNEENKINGKYQVNRITIPLNYNGMMSITATKIIEQVY